MNTGYTLSLVAFLMLCPLPSRAREAVSRATVTRHIEYLASDSLGGRGVGQPGIELAAEYIAKALENAGVAPGGEGGTYYQSFDIPYVASTGSLQVVGVPQPAVEGTDYQYFPFSAATPFEGDVVFVGYGITSTEPAHDDFAGIDVAGKVLLMFRYTPDGPEWKSEGRAPNRHALFSTKAERALEHHAAAVLIVDPPRGEPGPLFGSGQRRGRPNNIPMVHVTPAYAEGLLKTGGAKGLQALHDQLERGERCSTALSNVRLAGTLRTEERRVTTRNVMGVLRGEGPLADEFVVIGGHYDHLGTVQPTRMPDIGHVPDPVNDQIHNGADDNASGIAGMLELARMAAAAPTRPARSLLFMAFTGEEANLLGSRHFVEHPTIPLDKVVAMINLDMIGRLESDALEVYGSGSSSGFESTVTRLAEPLGIPLRFMPSGRGPSDHTNFYDKGIPVLFLHTGLHADYHTPTDDTHLIDELGLARVVQLTWAITHELLASPERPDYQTTQSAQQRPTPNVRVRMGFMPDYGESTGEGWPIGEVVADGPAGRAGLREGDRMLTIDDSPVGSITDYMTVIRKYEPGQTVTVQVLRGTERLELRVELEGR